MNHENLSPMKTTIQYNWSWKQFDTDKCSSSQGTDHSQVPALHYLLNARNTYHSIYKDDRQMLKAAFTLVFASFIRISEFTTPQLFILCTIQL